MYLSGRLEARAREIEEAYEEENPMAGVVLEYLERRLPTGWEDMDIYDRRQWLESSAEGTVRRTTVCTMEIWVEAMGGSPDRIDRYAGKEIRDILAKLPGWRSRGNLTKTLKPYGRQRYYERRD